MMFTFLLPLANPVQELVFAFAQRSVGAGDKQNLQR
jgi:hypothetical protein